MESKQIEMKKNHRTYVLVIFCENTDKHREAARGAKRVPLIMSKWISTHGDARQRLTPAGSRSNKMHGRKWHFSIQLRHRSKTKTTSILSLRYCRRGVESQRGWPKTNVLDHCPNCFRTLSPRYCKRDCPRPEPFSAESQFGKP